MSSLDALFEPRSVALVGASAEGTKLSCIVMKNLLRFKGSVYPVNPACPRLMEIPSYPSIRDIPEPVDLSIIMRPAHEVPEILRAHRGVARCAIVVSAGFAEIGAPDLQREIAAIGKELGIRILGPNCLGVFSPSRKLDTLFLPRERLKRPKRGKTAVVSQSGAILVTLLEALAEKGTGVSRAANYGNAVDIDAPDIYDYLADDADTEVVISYLESVGDGRRFVEAARRLAGRKGLVLLKAGKGACGGAAAYSHTGRLAGRYEVFRSVLEQFDIREAGDLDELLDVAHSLSFQRPAAGNRVCIVTNAGGHGVLAADECARQGLDLPPLPEEVTRRLRQALPPFYAVGNPTDLTGQVRDDDYRTALGAVRDHYDGFLVIALAGVAGITLRLAEILRDFRSSTDKPVVVHAAQGDVARKLIPLLEKAGLPVYPSPERAVRGLRAILESDREKDADDSR